MPPAEAPETPSSTSRGRPSSHASMTICRASSFSWSRHLPTFRFGSFHGLCLSCFGQRAEPFSTASAEAEPTRPLAILENQRDQSERTGFCWIIVALLGNQLPSISRLLISQSRCRNWQFETQG